MQIKPEGALEEPREEGVVVESALTSSGMSRFLLDGGPSKVRAWLVGFGKLRL